MIDFAPPPSVSETPESPAKEKQVLTFSSLNVLRTCPRQFKLRFIDQLFPVDQDADQRYFGTVIHRALEIWYGSAEMEDQTLRRGLALETIDKQCKDREKDPDVRKMWFLARSMFEAYIDHYGNDNSWKIRDIEKAFVGKIINPETNAQSKTFEMKGKIDLLIEVTGSGEQDGLYIVDHKTLSSWTEKEIDKLHIDTQMAVYVYYMRQLGIPVKGFVYNVLLKTQIKQKQGETQEEFDLRYAEACAKNKSGKSSATRELPETDEQYAARLADWFKKEQRFHRIVVELPESRLNLIQQEIWDLTQDYLSRKRRDYWCCNSGACYQYFRPCDYLPYCRSNFNEQVKKELFGVSDTAHPEFEEWSGGDL